MNSRRPGIGQRKRQLTQLPGPGNWRHRHRGRTGPSRWPAAPPGQAARPRRHLAAGDAERASVTRRVQWLAHSRRPDPAAVAIINQGIHKPPSMINRGTALRAGPTRARYYECPACRATASQLLGRPGSLHSIAECSDLRCLYLDVLAAPVNYQPFQVARLRPGFFPAAAGRWRRDLPGRCQRRCLRNLPAISTGH